MKVSAFAALITCFTSVFLTYQALAQWPKNASGNEVTRSEYRGVTGGCAVSPGDLPRYLSTIRFSATITQSDPEWEIYRGLENGDVIVGGYFDVSPGFALYDDDKPNAFSTKEDILEEDNEDGSVLYGRKLFAAEKRAHPRLWGASITFVIAHEYAHILQFKRNLTIGNPARELHADYLAGWVLGKENRKRNAYYTDMDVVVETLLRQKSYAFSEPNSHGTPEQRLSAMRAGYKEGESNASLDAAYSKGLRAVT